MIERFLCRPKLKERKIAKKGVHASFMAHTHASHQLSGWADCGKARKGDLYCCFNLCRADCLTALHSPNLLDKCLTFGVFAHSLKNKGGSRNFLRMGCTTKEWRNDVADW